jgi:hypothetical protein
VALSQAQAKDPKLAGPLGSLALCQLRANTPMMLVRAIRWYRDLARLGMHVPLFVVNDLGMLYAAPEEQWVLGHNPSLNLNDKARRDHHDAYGAMIRELAESETCKSARILKLSDELVTVLLARLLAPIVRGVRLKSPYPQTLPLEPELVRDIREQELFLFESGARDFEFSILSLFARKRLHFLTGADALDLDTLRLLGMLGPEAGTASSIAHVDLLAATKSLAANNIVNFSLELLPSVLETARTKSTGTVATHGYSGLGTQGSIDSMVLTELAWDDLEFGRRQLEKETLYYTREQSEEEAKRLHYLIIDASASMRGDREVFARGVAIALIKKLQLQGEDVWLRFFDSRLYETHKTKSGSIPVAHLLGFRGERGRNPVRVFAQLATELALLKQREHRDPIVHLITHAALHVPRTLISDVQEHAQLFGIFIVPSGGALSLEYLDLLKGHVVVSHDMLVETSARASAAKKIVEGASAHARTQDAAPKSMRTSTLQSDAIPPSMRGKSIPPPSLR